MGAKPLASERPCHWCKQPFRPRVDALRDGNGRYCSKACGSKSRWKPLTIPPEEAVRMYVEDRLGIWEIAKAVNAPWREVAKVLHAAGVVIRPGGSRRHSGYLTTAAPPGHANGSTIGRIAVHTLVASQKIGRPLTDDEVTHHLDGDKQNNDPANLEVMTKQAHGKLHQQLERLGRDLLKGGLIVFSPDAGYTLSSRLEQLLRSELRHDYGN